MLSTLILALSLDGLVDGGAVKASAVAAVVAGLAVYSALHAKGAPNWLRADFSVVAVILYAFAFGRMHVIGRDSVEQIVAYSIGFMLASMLEPIGNRLRAMREREDQE
jgi:hypothetical protein